MYQLTQYTRGRLVEEVVVLVERSLEERGLALDDRREAAQATVAHLLGGIDAEDLAAEVAQEILEQAKNPHNGDYVLDLLLLHRLNAGLENRLPWHVAQAIAGLARLAGRRR